MAKSLDLGGRYTVENLEDNFLGEGGMAKVYLGKDVESGAPVAIKTLHADKFNNQPEILERFLREGELLRQLNHPNIVKMLDVLEVEDIHYLVMEYVEGGDLNALLEKEGKLSIEQTLAIALELADALTRAHHLNIIHRDIKPGNVLLAPDSTPRLTDFGIAHFDSDLSITRENEVLGTMPYLSPEGCIGEGLDARSDVWSFGVLLYELLTGDLPFGGDNEIVILASILHKELPDIQEDHPNIPDALADLIYRMLVKDPDGRIPSVRLVGAELESIIKGFDIILSGKTGKAIIEAIKSNSSSFATPKLDTDENNINLPTQSTRFIGRKNELEEITTLLTKSETRLVTLLGSGGMGKTRLGIEAARQLAPNYERGVHFVDLAPINDPEQIVTAIAKVFELQSAEDVEPRQQIIYYLQGKQLLLLMDNFEHVAEGASLLADILAEAPQVKILTTSRARLNLRDERVFEVSGMIAPEDEEEVVFEDIEAVELFVQHARRARLDYELIEEDKPAVLKICQLVGGMPLGIQLAAGWIRSLPPEEIAEELAKDMEFLESSLQDLPERQHSMRAVFEYSWKLLPEELRDSYKKLSVFRGGFTREAAKVVAGAGVRALTSLVDYSLLQRTPAGRFVVHELMRQFAEDELASKPNLETEIRDGHWDFFAEFLASHEEQIEEVEAKHVLDAVHDDLDNILSAWDWAINSKRFENMSKALPALWSFLEFRSMTDVAQSLSIRAFEILEKSNLKINLRQKIIISLILRIMIAKTDFSIGRLEWEERMEEIIKDIFAEDAISEIGVLFIHCFWGTSLKFKMESAMELFNLAETVFRKNQQSFELGWALHAKARCVWWFYGRPKEAQPLLAISLAFAEKFRSSLTFHIQGDMGIYWRDRGDYHKAIQYFEKAIEYREQIWDNPHISNYKRQQAQNYSYMGDYSQAKTILEELLLKEREIGLPTDFSQTLYRLAEVHTLTGNFDIAHQQLSESAVICTKNNFIYQLFNCRRIQGKLAYLEGNLAEAQKYLEPTLIPNDLNPVSHHKGRSLSLLGEVQRSLGEKDAAWNFIKSAVQINLEYYQIISLMESLVGLARWLQDSELFAEAVEVITVPLEHIGTTHYDRTQAQDLLTELEAKMDAKEFEQAKNKGKELTAEDIYERYWGAES